MYVCVCVCVCVYVCMCLHVCMYVYLGNFSETLLEVFLSQGIATSMRVHFLTRLFLMTMSGRFAEIWTLVCCFHINISFFNPCSVPFVQYFLRPSGLHAFAVCICCPDVLHPCLYLNSLCIQYLYFIIFRLQLFEI